MSYGHKHPTKEKTKFISEAPEEKGVESKTLFTCQVSFLHLIPR